MNDTAVFQPPGTYGDRDLETGEQPAFPFHCQGPTTAPEFYYGLTKREHFASLAMQALISMNMAGKKGETPEEALSRLSRTAVVFADGLIAALE